MNRKGKYNMRDVVIVEGVRTAIGRIGGTLKNVEPDFLGAHVITELLNRLNIEGSIVDEVILGQAKQSADYPNIARKAALRAGLPVEIPGYTVHRQCGSGLQSINNATQAIQSNIAAIIIAGGTESMSTAPYYMRNVRFGLTSGNGVLLDPNTESQPKSQPEEVYGSHLTMGGTIDDLVRIHTISREEQDEYALRSQIIAKKAIEEGKFKEEIVPLPTK